ncbi:hypothetical protein AJ78_02312 [Emergomyces pasteurianus Ep9510]|uniref:PSI domain-containing protein n=1 Tax=Emergomyces pasteurianus Ep9510 TaxID=1447872 RepID=A0A1J9QQS2_9EURO|nr:hypothetical protein AJ78_02312 [Emergomyces pasteurianus Ep9510]
MAEAAAAPLGLHLPSRNSTSEISPEFLSRHHRKDGDGGGDGDNDPLLYFCWRQQSCGSCLESSKACSWCFGSSTCVPNSAPFPLLAPLTSSSICPLASRERWELRATPLGCNVSTLTFLTSVASVLGTVVLLLVGWVIVVLGRKGWRAVRSGARAETRTGDGGRRRRDWGDWGEWGFIFRDRDRGRGSGGRRWLGREAGRRVVVFVEDGRGTRADERRPLLV